MIQGLSDSKE